MRLATDAIIIAVRQHGEHGALVRALTPAEGVQAGYVRGGRSRARRPVLVPGNSIAAEFRARSDEQLAHLTAELSRSRAPLLGEPLAAAAMEWVTGSVDMIMPHETKLAATTFQKNRPQGSGFFSRGF